MDTKNTNWFEDVKNDKRHDDRYKQKSTRTKTALRHNKTKYVLIVSLAILPGIMNTEYFNTHKSPS